MNVPFLKKLYIILILPYTVYLFYLMIFGFGRTMMEDNIVRLKPIFSTISFVESCIAHRDWMHLIGNLVGNIVLFVPFGFLGWIFPKFQNFRPLIYAFISAIICVEALQYFTRMGIMDIDDVLFNSFGVWLGFLMWKKLKKVESIVKS